MPFLLCYPYNYCLRPSPPLEKEVGEEPLFVYRNKLIQVFVQLLLISLLIVFLCFFYKFGFITELIKPCLQLLYIRFEKGLKDISTEVKTKMVTITYDAEKTYSDISFCSVHRSPNHGRIKVVPPGICRIDNRILLFEVCQVLASYVYRPAAEVTGLL